MILEIKDTFDDKNTSSAGDLSKFFVPKMSNEHIEQIYSRSENYFVAKTIYKMFITFGILVPIRCIH